MPAWLRNTLGWFLRRGLALGLSLSFSLSRSSGQITTERFLDFPGQVNAADVSPDGKQVAFVWWPPEEQKWGIYVSPVAGGGPVLFAATNDQGLALSPKWSPDGKWIAFLRSESTHGAILVVEPKDGGDERHLGVTCGDSLAWSADSGVIIATSQNGASGGQCGLTAYSIMSGGGSRELGVAGGSPVLSEDGRTLAFSRSGEIRLLPVTPQGNVRGSETVVAKEPGGISSLAWVPGVSELAYVSSEDLSKIKIVDVKGNPVTGSGGEVEGEVMSLSSSINGGLLGALEVRSNSYWTVDLRSAHPRAVFRRPLPWNVTSVAVDKGRDGLLYSVSSGSSSQVYRSSVSDARAEHLLDAPFTIDSVRWSPNSERIALIGHSGGGQLEPGRLFVTTMPNAVPQPFATQLGSVTGAAWAPDGKDLFLAAETHDSPAVWRLGFNQPGLSKVADLSALEIAASSDGRYLYLRRRPFDLVQVPIAGGAEEYVASGALEFTVGEHEVYIERQDSHPPSPEGLSLYRIDSPGTLPQFVTKIGFLVSSMSLFDHGQQLGMERRDPPQERLVRIKGLRK
jgi:Tol biopolymer transport system component